MENSSILRKTVFPASTRANSGRNGDNPLAIKSAFMKCGQSSSSAKKDSAKVVLPAYRTFADFSNKQIQGRQLGLFGSGCQRIGLHDYALFTRQVFISAKNKFDQSDVDFIQKSVSELVGKDTSDEIAKKLSQLELATQANRSMQYISLLESGHHQPTLGTLQLLSGALGLSLTRLVYEIEEEAE